jgi:PAS domain S-box-containing protein
MVDDPKKPPLDGIIPELAPLITFLEIDARPTAIVRLNKDHTSGIDAITALYENHAWKLSRDPQRDTQDVIQALHCELEGKPDISLLHGRSISGKRWEIRICGEFGVVIAADTTQEHDEAERKVEDSADNAKYSSRDWTRGDASGDSTWIGFIRSRDWASTSLGPMSTWSQLFRQHILAIMANPNPRLLIWGKDMTFVYNEACVQLFGEAHPFALGRNATEPWSESWTSLKPLVSRGYQGYATRQHDLALALERKGSLEETYWDMTILPILDMGGEVVGVVNELTETSMTVLGERRRAAITNLSDNIASATTFQELWAAVLKGLEASTTDIPSAILYEVVPEETDRDDSAVEETLRSVKCALVGALGVGEAAKEAITEFAFSAEASTAMDIAEACRQAWHTREPVPLSAEEKTLPTAFSSTIQGRGSGEPVKEALVYPINSTTGGPAFGFLIVGLNPRSNLDSYYRLWLHIVVDFIEKAASLISLPQEQRRAKTIADDMVTSLAHQLRFMTLQVERSEAKFTRLASTAPTGMFMYDGEGRMLYVNDTYLEMLGETRESYHSRGVDESHWQVYIHEDDLPRLVESWQEVSEKKRPVTLEYRLKKPWKTVDTVSGQETIGENWVLLNAFPEIEADGKITSIQGWLTNISHRKFSEKLMSQRLNDALENKRQTENFIDMTSHEMRNPLSAILQSADSIVSTLSSSSFGATHEMVALQYDVLEDLVDAAQTIILCAQHQKRIVDDILTMSKLDADLLEISPDRVRLPMLVEKALKMYEAELERADIEAKLCVEPTYDELNVDWVLLDPSRCLQVIINLLTNSIKFTRNSDVREIKIVLGASYAKPTGKHHRVNFIPPRPSRSSQQIRAAGLTDESPGEDIYLQIGVYDTGSGLTEDEMKVLFQRFQQGSPKTYKHYGGSGLGLFISRELCELQGGQIGVASGNGKTVFTFFVRAKRCGDTSADDPAGKPRFPSCFVSASASPMAYSRRSSNVLEDGTTQMSYQLGKDGTMEHDFQPSSLKRTMSQLARGSGNISPSLRAVQEESTAAITTVTTTTMMTTTTASMADKSLKPDMHVLIVEDNIINQKVLSTQLKRAGCIVHVANHGLECLEFLDKSIYCSKLGGNVPLSIVLLDLEMPTMDGLTCIRHIRERQHAGQIERHIPVIAVTANARSEQISMAIEAGMDSVVTKPFRIPELVPQMERLIVELASAGEIAVEA